MEINRNRWLFFLLLYIEMLVAIINIQFLAPLIPEIRNDLGLSYAQSGILMGIISLGGIFLCIPLGFFIDKLQSNFITIFALFAISGGTFIFSLQETFVSLYFFRFLSGLGVMVLTIITPKLVTRIFPSNKLGLPMGIFNTAVPVGTIFAFSIISRISNSLEWRTIAYLISCFSFLVILLHMIIIKFLPNYTFSTNNEEPQNNKFNPVFIFKNLNLWTIALLWLFYNAATMAFSTFGCDYFISKSFSIGEAGLLTSTVTWGALILSPIIGVVLDYGVSVRKILFTSCIILSISFILILSSINLSFSLIIFSISAGLVPAPVYYIIPLIVNKKYIGIAYGTLMSMLNIGILLGPYLVGISQDVSKSFRNGFILMSFFALIASFFSIALTQKNNK